MRDVSCKLLSSHIIKDSIGVEKKETKETKELEIPITKVENIYAEEFYRANEVGHKPSLRLRINALNYSNEEELIYMNTTYTIIRVEEITADELILICERKIKDV